VAADERLLRSMAKGCAEALYASREALEHPVHGRGTGFMGAVVCACARRREGGSEQVVVRRGRGTGMRRAAVGVLAGLLT
jgi:hypothetical protein